MGTNRYYGEYRGDSVRYANVSRMAERTRMMMGDEYVDGNTVRRVNYEVAPAYDEPIKKTEKRSDIKKNSRYNENKEARVTYRAKSKCMSGIYAFTLAMAAVVTLVLCVQYLKVQTEIADKTQYISSLKQNITTLSSQNDAMDYSINGFIDIDNVYKVATEELGMVMASEDNVKIYESTEQEYMMQVSDIPEE